ncbi:MAG: hypothetical protein AXA67_07680 [Methylothermaceae bacteria B42]|nr:MAG: hypothetical protein AXA67_07680 [Methylothermaceae bacteria B42]HHJ40096.1 DUF2892 domain-containing protein [Methylothermaceae bacterium]
MGFDFKKMLKYERNIGDKEQKIRYGIGALLIFISLFLGSVILLMTGIVLLATGYTRWCPINSGLGRNTFASCCGGAQHKSDQATQH